MSVFKAVKLEGPRTTILIPFKRKKEILEQRKRGNKAVLSSTGCHAMALIDMLQKMYRTLTAFQFSLLRTVFCTSSLFFVFIQ